jgi:hypothetical protein
MAKEIFKKIRNSYNAIVSNAALAFYFFNSKFFSVKKTQPSFDTIIFSFDRPLQLFSLLESILKNQNYSNNIYIIFKSSDEKYKLSYDEVFSYFLFKLPITIINESIDDFKRSLVSACVSLECTHYLFYVDDQLLIDKSTSAEIAEALSISDIYTFRIGLNTKYCYTLNKNQNLVDYNLKRDFIYWNLSANNNDFNYPFSVDGTFLPAKLVRPLVKYLIYSGPNSLETSFNYSRLLAVILRIRISAPLHQKCVNFAINRVQSEVVNRSAELSNDDLHLLFQQNLKIVADEELIDNIDSPHTEVGYKIVLR